MVKNETGAADMIGGGCEVKELKRNLYEADTRERDDEGDERDVRTSDAE